MAEQSHKEVVVFAYDYEAGGPNVVENPIVSIGCAVVHVVIPTDPRIPISHRLVTKRRFDCWDGNVGSFDRKTLAWWQSLDRKQEDGAEPGSTIPVSFLENFRSSSTEGDAFRAFHAEFVRAYHLAKQTGAAFVPVTDCSIYDGSWTAYLSSKYFPHQRPIPMFGPAPEHEMLDPVDVSVYQAGMVAAKDPKFCIWTDGTKGAFANAFPAAVANKPDWVADHTHFPDDDSTGIAWRFITALVAQRGL